MTAEPDELIELAASVSEGAPIDWEWWENATTVSNESLLPELRVIAAIAAHHRSASNESGQGTRQDPAWGSLVLKERIGAGSFGVVYRAWDSQLQRDVALKLYRVDAAGGSAPAVLNEGRLLARVRHPNVVIVHGVEQRGNEVGLWLELIQGRTFADEVRDHGPLGFREAALVCQEVCRALAAVHRAGLIHRDVKPQNVMRENGGRVVLMDFGLTYNSDDESLSGHWGGTPLYMAPELFANGKSSVATDIYSLGVFLYFLVTGKHPVVGQDRAQLEQAHREGHRQLVRDLRPDLPATFVQVVEKACHQDARERFSTVGEMEHALAPVLGLPTGDRVNVESRRPLLTLSHWFAIGATIAVLAIAVVGIRQGTFPFASTAGVRDSGAQAQPSGVTPAVQFQASPTTVSRGQSAILTWDVSGASDVQIDHIGRVTDAGTRTVVPLETTIYTLTAIKDGLRKSASVEVIVTGRPSAPSSGPVAGEPVLTGRGAAPPAKVSEGRVVWTGQLAPGQELTMRGTSASAGELIGTVPSGPIRIQVSPESVRVTRALTGDITLRNTGSITETLVIVRWQTETP